MEPVRITWAEAEKIYPGIEAEWRGMCGQDGTCVPPTGKEWRLERSEWPSGTVVHVIQVTDADEYYYVPEWRRWPGGGWTHPYWMTKKMYESSMRLLRGEI
jgi:hypothetical protein